MELTSQILEKNAIIDNIANSYISRSPIHGYGLFASRTIEAGKIIGHIDGQLISIKSFINIYNITEKNLGNDFSKIKDFFFMEWNYLVNNFLLVRPFRTKYSFINHSIHSNVILKGNPFKKLPLQIIAEKRIVEGEEIFINYLNEPLPDIERQKILKEYN